MGRWSITNKLKINDSDAYFCVFRSPQLKYDLSGLSVKVGESDITQSSKVIYLGVLFDKFIIRRLLKFGERTSNCMLYGETGKTSIQPIIEKE